MLLAGRTAHPSADMLHCPCPRVQGFLGLACNRTKDELRDLFQRVVVQNWWHGSELPPLAEPDLRINAAGIYQAYCSNYSHPGLLA